MQAVQLVGCVVIGAALAVLLVSACFWLAVQVGGVICCGGGVPAGSSTGPVLDVCRRGQILHLTGVRSRCRALT